MTQLITLLFIKKWNLCINTALTITSPIRGSSKEKLYRKLGLGTLEQKGWYKKVFFKILKLKSPCDIHKLVSVPFCTYETM